MTFYNLSNGFFLWLTSKAEATTETNTHAYLGVWLRLLFKVTFVPKCIKIMFFYFLKIIFKISVLKQSKTYEKINF